MAAGSAIIHCFTDIVKTSLMFDIELYISCHIMQNNTR